MLSQIPFELPLRYLPGVTVGNVVRYGSILKDAGTGRILGHLQETGVAQSLLSSALSSASSPLSLAASVVNSGSNRYTAVQVRQLKAMMETLKLLQVATLGVSLVGVGVSAAGFMYMRKRFNSLDARVDKLVTAVHTGFKKLDEARLRQQMSRTKALTQRAELAGSMINPSKEYKEVAAGLADQAAFFEGEIKFQISTSGPVGHDAFWMMAQLWMLSNSVRIDCQIRANELHNAQQVSERVADEYQAVFEPLGPASFDVSHSEGMATIRVLRDATDAAHSKPFLLNYLRAKRIEGAAYIEGLEQEKEQPVLVLSA